VRRRYGEPRSGAAVYGFVAGLYPAQYPTLPGPDHDLAAGPGADAGQPAAE